MNQTTPSLAVNSVDETVVTAHSLGGDNAGVTKHIVDLMGRRKRGETIDGVFVITKPNTKTVEVVNFGLAKTNSYANTTKVKTFDKDDAYKLRAELRHGSGIRTYNEGEFGGDSGIYHLTRGYEVFAKEIINLVVSPEKT